MRVFVSYRRDDTGGRAGRLYDGLVAQFGDTNVFQDVDSIQPGTDFDAAIRDALASTEATLVVIGRQWAEVRDENGQRRLDRSDDYVRRELAAALSLGGRVVPVLVDQAVMPDVDQLPADVQGLCTRQAVEVRDHAWRYDVEQLIRRLEHAPRVGSRSRRRVVALIAAATLAMAATAVAWTQRRGTKSTYRPPPSCDVPDSSWTSLELAPAPTVVQRRTASGVPLIVTKYTIIDAHAQPRGGKWAIVLTVELANQTPAVERTLADDDYASEASVHDLVVDGIDQGKNTCFGPVTGNAEIAPGERVRTLVGYLSTTDPSRVPIVLETQTYDHVTVT